MGNRYPIRDQVHMDWSFDNLEMATKETEVKKGRTFRNMIQDKELILFTNTTDEQGQKGTVKYIVKCFHAGR